MAADGQTQKRVEENKPAEEKKPAPQQKLHVINANEANKRTMKAQRRRRIFAWASFVMCVIIPTALAAIYWFHFASDRYAVETKFAVRSPSSTMPSGDLLSMMTTMSSAGSTSSDSYMLVDFIESRDLIDRLEDKIDLREIYNTDQADFLTRLPDNVTVEELQDYMGRWISIYFDTASQILTLEVQAFDPEGAREVSQAILSVADDLVNEVSEQARFDSMASAEREVARIEEQLQEHRRAMVAFRDERQDVDPEASAGAQIELLGQLEGDLAAARTRMNSLLNYLSDDAPTVRVLRNEIQSLERQIADQRERLGTGGSGNVTANPDSPAADAENGLTLSERLGMYEGLSVDLEFLQQAYITALAAREAARLEADRQQRYIASFVRPSLPEESRYPKRVQNILVFVGFATMLWGIALMIVYVVREHST
jgi:capsular polysaccharide transport system permease protein